MEKLVSIILPTYNGALRIEGAIKSVQNQTYRNWELLIIDDGSYDSTEDIVRNFGLTDARIKYSKNEQNLGIQKTLNKGIAQSQGEYIARIDDDDIWAMEDKLEQQVRFFEENKQYILVGTGVIVVDENKKELFRYFVPETDKEIRGKLLGKNCFVHSSVLFRKDMFEKFGGYDESTETRHLEDYDLWLKLGTVGKFHNLPIFGVTFTLREGSLSSVNKIEQFKKSLSFIQRFKNFYPRYYPAVIRSIGRLIVYGFITKVPIRLSLNKLRKFDKENW